MTPEEMLLIFEGIFALVVGCYMIGLGIGLIVKIIRTAVE